MLIIDDKLRIPLREFQFTFARSSGPGGQNVNKVSTKAVLRWAVAASPSLPEPVRHRLLSRFRRRITAQGELLITSQRFRDAGRNTADCLEKLRQMLREAAEPVRPRRPTRPTRASVRRRIEDKRRQAQKKKCRRSGGRGDLS
jgi:ribosome-associated protein